MERTKTLAQHLSNLIQARLNCIQSSNDEWRDKHESRIATLARNFLPSGSGIDAGTSVDLERSTGDKIVLNTAFHHMHESGMYDGWTNHTVTIRPAFDGFTINISGRDRREIKDYLADTFDIALRQSITETIEGYRAASGDMRAAC
jgi:hypothetical protein